MSDTFTIITTLCYGRDNEAIDEIQDYVSQSLLYDPEQGAWYLGEWESDE